MSIIGVEYVDMKIIAHTSFVGHTGYSNHSREFLTRLSKKVPLRIRNYAHVKDISYLSDYQKNLIIHQTWGEEPWEIGSPYNGNPLGDGESVNLILMETNHYYFYDPYIGPKIAYNVWESTRQPQKFFNKLLEYEQLWLPSEWQKKVSINQGYPEDRIKVVREGVDGNIFKPSETEKWENGKFKFLIFGRWDYRKSIKEMIQTFLRTFRKDEDVELIISVDNPFPSDKMKSTEERLRYYNLEDPRIIVKHFLSSEDYVKHLQRGHVYLSCSRAEGWGLPLCEAIACGIPVICSNYGAQLEFANEIAHKVNIKEMKRPQEVFMVDEKEDIGEWSEPDFEHLGYVMREVYDNYEENLRKSREYSTKFRKNFSWDKAVEKATKLLNNLPPYKVRNFDSRIEFSKDGSIKAFFTSLLKDLKNVKASIKDSITGREFYGTALKIQRGIEYWVSPTSKKNEFNGILFEIEDPTGNILLSKTMDIPKEQKKFEVSQDLINKIKVLEDKEQIKKLLDLTPVKELKLNLGCGNDIKPGYINVDYLNNTGGIDVAGDIKELPFLDNSVDEIYLSHTLEHFSIKDVQVVLSEIHRILKPFGVFKVIVPDLVHIVKDWLELPEEKKFLGLTEIFGAQSHIGNYHYSGFSRESLDLLLERFNFKILESVNRKRLTHEIYSKCMKIEEPKKEIDETYKVSFVGGPLASVNGEDNKNIYNINFYDKKNNSTVHEATLPINNFTRPYRSYFTDWKIVFERNGRKIHQYDFDITNQRVLITFESSALGDNIAWIPYVEEFRKEKRCKVIVSTFWNDLFKDKYPELEFIDKGKEVQDLYASYWIGWKEPIRYEWYPHDYRTIPLQQTASDILGLKYKEIRTMVKDIRSDWYSKKKYVCLSIHSTCQAKYWNHKDGWSKVVEFLRNLKYEVVLIGKDREFMGNKPPNKVVDITGNKPIENTMEYLSNCQFYMGIGNGLSWLAWAMGKPVVLVSGFSAPWCEFESIRIHNDKVCNSCFNDPKILFNRDNWNWCPRDNNFICTSSIQPETVIERIKTLIKTENMDK